MPRMSDTMEEGVIAELHVKEGEQLKAGDVIAEVETDKATMEWESFVEGTILHLAVQSGDAVPVDGVVAVLGKEGEDFKELLEQEQAKQESESEEKEEAPAEVTLSAPAPSPTPAPEVQATPAPAQAPAAVASAPATNGRIKASPLARRIAQENNVDLHAIQGSGDEGRIVKKDVEAFIESGGAAAGQKSGFTVAQPVGQESYTEVAVSQMRKTIARRLSESKFSAPHFYLTIEVEMDRAAEARSRMNEISPVKISFNDLIIKAVSASLRQHPDVNSSWLGDRIRTNNHIHIGMAVAVDEGLLVPVIRFADTLSLAQIAGLSKDFAQKAKTKKLTPEEMQGNTFSISNLGMMGIEEFTAVINPPDACILAIGNIREVPAIEDGEIVARKVMKMTMSCDHRVVDGAVGSRFLQTLKTLLEDPVRMLI